MIRSMFLDLNAFFASVEQQLRPELRGKPVAVAPVMVDSTCCIAASYEAKKFGIKTGTAIHQAKRMCPSLRIVEARHAEYIRMHHKILSIVDTLIPIQQVRSIDECSCILLREQQQVEHAVALARRIKRAILQGAGECMRCSIGLAPNTFLAKVATDMQKPDGLVVIRPEDLPHKLFPLALTDLPGIARRMERRLNAHGITTVEQLMSRSEHQLERAWGGVVGRQWWHWLRGKQWQEPTIRRRSLSHSHVLPPALRDDAGAQKVMIRLIHKAGARLRQLNYAAGFISLHVLYQGGGVWEAGRALQACQDTLTMVEAFECLWRTHPAGVHARVGVVLSDLTAPRSDTLPLFPQEQCRRQLSRTMDRLNLRFGPHTVYFGGMFDAQHTAQMRIAFTSVPDPEVEV